MKQKTKLYSAVFAVALALAGFSTVFAADAPTTDNSSSSRPATTQRTLEARKNAVRDLMGAHITRLSVVTQRLSSILKRIESRRDKMADAGANVTSINASIAQAEKQLADAQETVDQAKSQLAEIDSAKDFKTAALQFVDTTTDLRLELRSVQNTLKSVVKAMLQAQPKPSSSQGDNNETK
jgi:chromosome segregation ATPase